MLYVLFVQRTAQKVLMCELSGFPRCETEVFALVQFCGALVGVCYRRFGTLLIPYARLKQSNLSSVESQESKGLNHTNAFSSVKT
jgi:hypothetical protein